jgi:hypothetical protein
MSVRAVQADDAHAVLAPDGIAIVPFALPGVAQLSFVEGRIPPRLEPFPIYHHGAIEQVTTCWRERSPFRRGMPRGRTSCADGSGLRVVAGTAENRPGRFCRDHYESVIERLSWSLNRSIPGGGRLLRTN